MKIKIRCLLITFLILSACYLSYWVATMSSHSSLEKDKDGGHVTQPEDYEQDVEQHRKDSVPEKVGDRQFANLQQNIVRKTKSNQQQLRSELGENWMNSEDESETDIQLANRPTMRAMVARIEDDDEETIELDEKRKQPESNANFLYVKSRVVQKDHIHVDEEVNQQKDYGIDGHQDVSLEHVQKAERVKKEEEDEYLSIDDLKEGENEESQFDPAQVGSLRKTKPPKLDVSKENWRKTANDMEEVEIGEIELDNRLKSIKTAGNDARVVHPRVVHPASHLRSHNIAPIPRIVQPSTVNALTGMLVTKRSHSAIDDLDVAGLLPGQSGSNQVYYLIHSGQASKVNQAVRINPLPDYIPTDYYIFSSKR